MTKKAFKDECDVNHIMRRFEKTGQLPVINRGTPLYGDYSEVPTYQDALNIVERAEQQFAGLPSVVRARFANDPAQFLNFANDPTNAEEMVKMGLATARTTQTPSKTDEDAPKTARSNKRPPPEPKAEGKQSEGEK